MLKVEDTVLLVTSPAPCFLFIAQKQVNEAIKNWLVEGGVKYSRIHAIPCIWVVLQKLAFQVYEILKINHEFLQFFWLGSKI